jgi:hypothetical protein
MINKIKNLRNQPVVGMRGYNPALLGPSNRAQYVSQQATYTPYNLETEDEGMPYSGIPAAPVIPTYTPSDIATYNALLANGRTFTKFDMADKVSNQVQVVTGGIWSSGVASLLTYFTSSVQTTTQRRYYVDVLNATPGLTGSVTNYSVSYGNANGSGSSAQGQLNDSAAKAIYSQYRQLLLGPSDSRFTTYGSGSTDSIYVITFKRSQLKERLDIGNFEVPLANITSRATNATGSVAVGSTIFTVIDDSSIKSSTTGDFGRVYNLVSGSVANGVFNSSAPVYYGLVYPDYGVIVLDGNALDQKLGFSTNKTTNSEGNNHFALFHSISGSALVTNPSTSDKYGFIARNSEKITSTHYFVRVKNSEYNFSNNPSFVTGSTGTFAQPSFVSDPKVYITSIGLYNDRQELLAIAKLSKPVLKTYQREALIRVKLDF